MLSDTCGLGSTRDVVVLDEVFDSGFDCVVRVWFVGDHPAHVFFDGVMRVLESFDVVFLVDGGSLDDIVLRRWGRCRCDNHGACVVVVYEPCFDVEVGVVESSFEVFLDFL